MFAVQINIAVVLCMLKKLVQNYFRIDYLKCETVLAVL